MHSHVPGSNAHRAWALLLIGLLALPGLALAGTPLLHGTELIDALRQGGYSIYFRHQATDWSQDDHVTKPGDWLSCDGRRIRQLSDAGRTAARTTGLAMRRLGIPVSRVLASPYCRCMETARLFRLGAVEPSEDVINLRIADLFGGQQAIVARAKALLGSPTEPRNNTVIVAHGNVARMATPVYPDEGEAVIFKADGHGGFDVVGRLQAAEWSELARRNDSR